MKLAALAGLALATFCGCAAGTHTPTELPGAAGLPKPHLVDPTLVCNALELPKLVERAEPVYPPELRALHISGFVIMEGIVGLDGHVRDVKVLRTNDHRFVDPAVAAISKWRYTPALCDGKPAELSYIVRTDFEIR